ncbi:MAG: ferredoxin [Patescibacteria group bacterium]
MEKRIKITLKKGQCIGCGTCVAICPKFFELKNEIANLKNSKENDEKFELEISASEDDLLSIKQAEKFCSTKSILIKEV